MKTTLIFTTMLLSITVYAQKENVGIGTLNPDNSAILELTSKSSGLLIPRMNNAQLKAISNPADGLMVYQTDAKSGFYYFSGPKNEWVALSEKSIVAAGGSWLENGNSIGAGAAATYFGTNSASPIVMAAGGRIATYISNDITNENVFVGLNAGRGLINNTSLGYSSAGTGVGNTSLGSSSLFSITNGSDNIGVGIQAAYGNTTGTGNLAIGSQALRTNQNGMRNIAIGKTALYALAGTNGLPGVATGSDNLAFGSGALETMVTGTFNTAIGVEAGYYAKGSNSLYLGGKAGPSASTTENGVLYINNARTDMPLIYGDFSAKYVTIGDVTPTLRAQGIASGGYNLLVKGGILTEKVKVAIAAAGTDWADYVFEPNYKANMMSLEDVEKYTLANKHLPNVPSAEEMVKGGLDVAQTSKMFMEKIEELTLYIIELNKEIQALKNNKK